MSPTPTARRPVTHNTRRPRPVPKKDHPIKIVRITNKDVSVEIR